MGHQRQADLLHPAPRSEAVCLRPRWGWDRLGGYNRNLATVRVAILIARDECFRNPPIRHSERFVVLSMRKGKQALDAVWDAMEQYTDPLVDVVMAESNTIK